MAGRRVLTLAGLALLAWLVVPASASANSNVTVSTNPDTDPVPPVNCQFAATGDNYNINFLTLQTCANSMPTSVSTSSTGANPGTITIQTSIVWSGQTLTLNANSTVGQSAGATMTGGGNLTVTTAAAPITLNEANNFGAVSLTNSPGANDASVTDTSGLSLGPSSVGRDLTVTATGIVTQSGALSVGGKLSVASGSTNAIVLLNVSNSFPKFAAPSAGVVQVTDSSAMALGNSSVGTLILNANGNLTQLSGEHLTVIGNTTLSIRRDARRNP